MNLKDFGKTQEIDKKQSAEADLTKEIKKGKSESKANNFSQNMDFEKILESDEFKKVEDEYGDVIQDFISKYGEMSEGDIVAEILRLVAIKKQEGTFDSSAIRSLANQITPMLNDEQRAKMNYLLSILD